MKKIILSISIAFSLPAKAQDIQCIKGQKSNIGFPEFDKIIDETCLNITKIECGYGAKTLIAAYESVFERFTKDSNENLPTLVGFSGQTDSNKLNLNIFSNFKSLEVKHKETFAKLKTIQDAYLLTLPAEMTRSDAQTFNKSLLKQVKEMNDALKVSSHFDSIFLYYLESASTPVTKLGISVPQIVRHEECSELKDSLTKITANVERLGVTFYRLKNYVGIAAFKRSLLVEKFEHTIKLAISRAVARHEGKELDEVSAELVATFGLDRVLADNTNWWIDATVFGLADNRHNLYFEFFEPLRILKSLKTRAEEFKSEVGYLSVSQEIKDKAIASINVQIEEISRNIAVLESRGAKGSLDLQKRTAQRFLNSSKVRCHREAEKFLAYANQAVDTEGYLRSEAQYKLHIQACRK